MKARRLPKRSTDARARAFLEGVGERIKALRERRPDAAMRDELVRCRILLANLLVSWDRHGPITARLDGGPTVADEARAYLEGV